MTSLGRRVNSPFLFCLPRLSTEFLSNRLAKQVCAILRLFVPSVPSDFAVMVGSGFLWKSYL